MLRGAHAIIVPCAQCGRTACGLSYIFAYALGYRGMNIRRPFPDTPCVALFDLDGTLTWHDTLLPFLSGYVLRHPARWIGLWRLIPALIEYALRGRDRGRLKSRVIRASLGEVRREDLDAWAESFVHGLEHEHAYRPAALKALAAHRAKGDHPVLLSASPDLYVPRIGRQLGFEHTLCTEILWRADRLDGALKSPNRRGEEKLRCLEWLRTQYPGAPIIAYGNSSSDLAHLARADRAVLVNAGAGARRRARSAGIAVADWT